MDYLLLAQSVEAADAGLSLVERLLQGGLPLVLLALAVVCAVAFYWQLRKNQTMQDLHLEEVKARAKESLTKREELLREMLEHSTDGAEAQNATVQTIDGFSNALRDSTQACTETATLIRTLTERVKALEDELRRR